ncbi:MAG TPA: HAD family hydrolase [Caldimonas sp.]|nr:HAD family hydrolase [Caldimonas sp.]HEX2542612.1 HAD family hydrolase [Caldimonas sp.]
MSAPLALFDLDGTLLSGDTDELWCEFLIDAGVLDRDAFADLNADIAARYASGAISAAEFCAFYASTLAGRSADAWAPLRGRFVSGWIEPRLGAQARALVAKHRERGDTLVLTTATNRFLAEPVAAVLGMDHLIATELEVEGGVFTGRNTGVLNMREGKVRRLQAWLRERGEAIGDVLPEAFFYSDSINDADLLRAVGRPVAVDPDERLALLAQGEGWPVVRLARFDAPLSGRR